MNKSKEIDFTASTRYKSLYKCSSYDQFIDKISKLKEAMKMLEDNIEEKQKAYNIYVLFLSYKNGFDLAYKLLLENGEYDPLLNDCYEYISIISNQIRKWQENGMYDEARASYKLSRDKERSNFTLAAQVLMDYINFKDGDINDFCTESGISLDDFKKYERIVFRLASDSMICKEYLEKQDKILQNYYQESINNMVDIANAIKNGYFKDGTEFSELEFWARIPFRNNPVKQFNQIKPFLKDESNIKTHFRRIIQTFANSLVNMNILTLEQYQIINNYLIDNNIGELFIITEVDIRHYASGLVKRIVSIEDKTETFYNVTDKDIKNVIEYMKSRKMSMNFKIFNIVLDIYISGKLNINCSTKKHVRG